MRHGWTLSNDGGAANNGMEPLTELGNQLVGTKVIEAARAAMAIHLAQRASEIVYSPVQPVDRDRPLTRLPRAGGLS